MNEKEFSKSEVKIDFRAFDSMRLYQSKFVSTIAINIGTGNAGNFRKNAVAADLNLTLQGYEFDHETHAETG